MIFEKAGVGTSTEVNYDSKSRNDGIKEIINNDNILIEGFLPEESDLLNEVICIRNTDNDNSNYENFQVDLTRSPEFNTSNSKAIDELMLNGININSDTLYFTFHENNEVDIGSKTDRNTEAILKNNKLTEFSTLCNIKESNNHIGNYNLTNRIPIINLVLSESNVNVQNNYCEIKTINDKQNNVSKTVYEFLKYIERIQNLICVNFRKTKYLRSGIVGLNIFGFKCESKTKRMKKKKMDNNVIKNHFQLSIKNKMNIFRLRDSRKSDGTEFVIDLGSSFFQIPSEVNSLQNENTSVDSTKNDGIETFVLFSDKEIKTMIMNDFGGNKGNLSNKIIELNDNDSIVKKAEFDKKDEFFVTEKNQENVVELEKKNSHFENTNSELFFGGDNDSNDTDTKTEGCENNTTYDEHEKYLYSTSKDSDKINMDNANNFDDNIIDGIIMEGFDYFCVENENKTKYTTSESNYSNKESDLGKYRYERNDIDRLSVFNNMYCERITEGNNGKLDEFNYNEGIDILLDNESYSVDKSRNKFPVIESEGDDGENINSSEIKDAYSAIIEEEYVVNDLLKSESTNLQFNIEGAKQQIENCYINDRENMLLLENFIEGSSHEQTNDASRELETRNEINTEFKKKGNKINSVIDSHSEKSTISEIPNLKETEYELNLELNSKKKKFGVFDKLICLTRNRNIVRMHSSNFTKETIKAIDIIKSSRKTNNKSGLIK